VRRGVQGGELDLVPTVTFGAGQRVAAGFEQVVGGSVAAGEDGAADAHREHHVFHGIGDLVVPRRGVTTDALGDDLRLRQIGFRQQYREQATGQACREVVLTRGALDRPRRGPQHGVAGGLTVIRVDPPKPVDVEQQQHGMPLETPRPVQLARRRLRQVRRGEELRQAVLATLRAHVRQVEQAMDQP
jgi:hypothetical protein